MPPSSVDPTQRSRLVDIRDYLLDRIAEAEREGWAGEAEGLKVSLAAANPKLAQVDGLVARRKTVPLGMPTYRDVVGRTATLPIDHRTSSDLTSQNDGSCR